MAFSGQAEIIWPDFKQLKHKLCRLSKATRLEYRDLVNFLHASNAWWLPEQCRQGALKALLCDAELVEEAVYEAESWLGEAVWFADVAADRAL